MICSCIQPNLWLGPALRTLEEFTHLQSLKITAILSVQDEDDRNYDGIDSERASASKAGLAFASVAVRDFDNAQLQERLPECVRVLERLLHQGHTVYVHCHAGISRSPTVVAAYLHWCCGWKLDEALTHVKRCRPCSPMADAITHAQWPPTPTEELRP
jgi:atypical dual specificity phosphatase